MRKHCCLRFLRLLLYCLVAQFCIAGAVEAANTATYLYDPVVGPPLLLISYDSRSVHFQKAPVEMIAADFSVYGGGDARPSYLNKLPFWIYAEYKDNDSKCQYDLIDGLRPTSPDPLPEMGNISLGYDPASAAVIRNCGGGFELVSRLNFDGSIFDEPFHPPALKGPAVDEGTRIGLMDDFVKRMLHALGGRAAFQKKLDEGLKGADARHPQSPVHYTGLLASALIGVGIRVQ